MWGKDIKDEFSQKVFNVIMPKFPIRADYKYEKFEIEDNPPRSGKDFNDYLCNLLKQKNAKNKCVER